MPPRARVRVGWPSLAREQQDGYVRVTVATGCEWAGVESSDAGGQGLVSLDAPGGTLSASVPLPAGATSSSNGELVAAPIPLFSPSMGVGIGLGRRWYVGGRYLRANVRTSLDGSDDSIPPAIAGVRFELDAQLSAFGLRLQRDTRDSTFYPTRGTLLDFEANFFDSAFGSDFTFQTYALACNRYFEVATDHVVALRAYGRAASGDAPFFALSSFGTRSDLRGYTPGRYRDKLMVAVQAEYRWRITSRLGLVAFGGAGSVAPEIGQFDQLLPSAGARARYVVAKKNNVSLRFDAAWGRDETTFYIGIGEAF